MCCGEGRSVVSSQERLLTALQDLDLMLKEAHASEELGFPVNGLEQLQEARARLAQQLEAANLQHYERAKERYGRAVMPVTADMCLGCFARLPSVYRSHLYDDKVRTCQSCGRFLYYPQD